MPVDGYLPVSGAYQVAFLAYVVLALLGLALRLTILWRVWRLFQQMPAQGPARQFLHLSGYWIAGETGVTAALLVATMAQAIAIAWLYGLILLFVLSNAASFYGMLMWVAMWLREERDDVDDRPVSRTITKRGEPVLDSIAAWDDYLESVGFPRANGAAGQRREGGGEKAA